MSTTWNPSDKAASVALSNGNLTVGSSSATNGSVRSVDPISTTAGVIQYCEISWPSGSNIASSDYNVGIGNASESLANYCGQTNNSCGLGPDTGHIQLNNATQFTMAVFADGDWAGVAFNVTANRIYFNKNGGAWHNSGDPVAGTGGQVLTAVTGTRYLMATVGNTSDVETLRSVRSSWLGTPPTGAQEFGPIHGVATQSLAMGQTAAGTVALKATATQSLSMGQTATGAVALQATATQSLSMGQTAAGALAIKAQATQSLSMGQTATSTLAIKAAAAQSLGMGQTATSTLLIQAAATQSLLMGQVAAGALAIQAVATQSLSMGQTATGTFAAGISGTATQSLSMGQVATGEVLIKATAPQSFSMGQSATGALEIQAQATQSFSMGQSVTGKLEIHASADQSLSMGQVATAILIDSIHATADQSLSMGQTATGKLLIKATAAQSLHMGQVATARGAVDRTKARHFNLRNHGKRVTPAIQEPTEDPKSLRTTVGQLKEAVETMQGQRGKDHLNTTITYQDLVNLGLIDTADIPPKK